MAVAAFLKSAVCTSRAVSAAHTPGLAAITTHIGFVALLAADMRAFAARGRSTALLGTKDPEATTTGRDQLAIGARLQIILLVPPFLGLGSVEATRAAAKIALLAGTGRLGAPLAKEPIAIGIRTKTPQ